MKLAIYVSDVMDQTVDLALGTNRIGSDPGCHVVIPHPEVAASIATIEVGPDGCRIQNLCPYEIYVGQQPLGSQAWGAWPVESRVHVTKSVALGQIAESLRGKGKPRAAPTTKTGVAGEASEAEVPRGNKQLIQISVICIALVLGLLLLLDDSQGSSKPDGSYGSFLKEIVAQPDGSRDWDSLTAERRRIAVKMQDAWEADLRHTRRSSDWASRELQELLDDSAIRSATDESLEGRIRAFANWRLSVISPR